MSSVSYRLRKIVLNFGLIGPILASPSINASDQGHEMLEEVIVTARKKAENMQKTPVSVTSISGKDIEAAKLFDLRDLQSKAPNLNTPVAADGGGSTFQAYIRGVGQFDFGLTTDPGVGIYIDGVYLTRTIASNLEFSDVEQIEVMRGPQGTLFGKNTIGGAIQVVTRKPNGDTRHSAKITAGDYNYKAFDGYVEFPVSDKVAASISVMGKNSDGWQKRNRGDNAGNDNSWGIRSHLGIDFSETWGAHFIVDHTDIDQNAFPHVLIDFDANAAIPPLYNAFVVGPLREPCCTPNKDIDRSDVLNEKDREVVDNTGFNLTNTWDFDNYVLRSISSYRTLESETYRDTDNSERDYFSVESLFDVTAYSQEFLLSNSGPGKLDWLVGLFYMKEDGNQISNTVVAGGLYDAVILPLPPKMTDFDLFYDRTQVTESYAAFLNATWPITESTSLNFGGRYTVDEKKLEMYTLRAASQTPIVELGPTDPSSCSDSMSRGNGSVYFCHNKWEDFSPKIGIDHQFSDDVMAYAHVTKGFRSGVYNGRPIERRHVSEADPELLISYEAGLKSRFWNERLQINGAIFYNDYEDQQLLVIQSAQTAAGSLALVVDNAADSVMQGAELEIKVLPLNGLMISGNVGWVDPEYKRFMAVDPDTGADVDLSDRNFAQVPELTASYMIRYAYSFQNGSQLILRHDASYISDIYYNNDKEARSYETLHAPGYTIYNAGISFVTPKKTWEFSVFGRNITDKRVINGGHETAAFGTTDATFTPPSRIFASIKYSGF